MMFCEKPIGEIADVTKLAGFEFTKYIKYNETGEIIALRALNLRNGELDLSDIKRIDRSVSEGLTRSKLYENDILLTYTGNGYGDCAIIEENDKYHLAPNICKIVPNRALVEPYFLYSYIRSNDFYKQMSSNMTGSGQPTIPMKTIRTLKVPVPQMEIQKKIANIIQAINLKLRTNRAINENLEQQISSIYANFCESKSWKPCELGSIIDVKDGTHDSPKPQTSGYLLVTSKHLLPYGVDRITPNRITEKDFKKINERSLVEQGDVLMSMIGTIGLISFVTEREIDYAIKNVALFKTSRTPNLAYYFLTFLKSNKTQQYIEMCLAGSTQKYISLGELRKMPIPVPDSETLECFNEIVSPMYQAIILNSKENYAFAALRDSLLPKLMSGEIDVSKIDI